MPIIQTKYFGAMPFEETACFDFACGLPAFEEERSFLPIESPAHKPLLFLQSVTTPSLCFIALPVLVADAEYQPSLTCEDAAELELPENVEIKIGHDVLILTLLSIRDNAPPTANLLAPLVINLANRKALQAIRHDHVYSHEQPLKLRVEQQIC